jgi:hypothetical protein
LVEPDTVALNVMFEPTPIVNTEGDTLTDKVGPDGVLELPPPQANIKETTAITTPSLQKIWWFPNSVLALQPWRTEIVSLPEPYFCKSDMGSY